MSAQITGVDRLLSGLNPDIPKEAVDAAVDSLVAYVIDRPGSGVGAQNNDLSATSGPLGATVSSTLNWPRTVGRALGQFDEAVWRDQAPGALDEAARNIEAGWGR